MEEDVTPPWLTSWTREKKKKNSDPSCKRKTKNEVDGQHQAWHEQVQFEDDKDYVKSVQCHMSIVLIMCHIQ